MKKIVFNGKEFLRKTKRGVQRYAYELVIDIDKYLEGMDAELLVPYIIDDIPKFKNIKVKAYGGWLPYKGWQYLGYQYYVWKEKAIGVSLSADIAPLFYSGIVAIHDMRFNREKNEYKSLREFLANRYKLYTYYLAAKNAMHLITVSEYQKNEIIKYYGTDKNKISVIHSACNHLRYIKLDESKFKIKYKDILTKNFYFFLGGREKNKNVKWAIEVAKRNKDSLFVMAGPSLDGFNLEDKTSSTDNVDNLIHVGFITDEEIAFFMKHCKAFIFPSTYEGFGLPPLEALYFGAKVLCSNASCLPEIYKNYVAYFDPYDYDVNLDELLNKKVDDAKSIFSIYSFEIGAKQLFNLIKKVSGESK